MKFADDGADEEKNKRVLRKTACRARLFEKLKKEHKLNVDWY